MSTDTTGRQATRVRPEDPVRMIMSTPVATVDSGASVLDAATELVADETGAVLVTGAGALGLLSERDVLTLVGTGVDLAAIQVVDVMTEDLVWARPDDTVAAVAHQMVEAKVRHLPVGDGRHAVGIVSLRDLTAVLVAAIRGGTPPVPGR
ncbi:CBS domain-containing protein [Pseudonocardia sp.]|uniref:CBS domain-containing protein n=1 Tax=Pseudonocardia sp. TaxID=60912 RepID=UPI003D0DA9CE